jgi:hypothetical protein
MFSTRRRIAVHDLRRLSAVGGESGGNEGAAEPLRG